MRKIGMFTDGVFKQHDFERGFELMKRCGFDCADYNGLDDPDSEFAKLTLTAMEKKMREVKAAADNAGIEIYQMHGPWTWPIPNGTAEERRIWTEYAKKCVTASAELGSPRYVVHPMMPFGPAGEENREVYLNENRIFLSELCTAAKKVGSVICLENMPFVKQSLYTPRHMMDFIAGLSFDNLKVCLDTGHALYVGIQPADAVRELGDVIGALHVHDNFGNGDHHLVPFTGKTDWTEFSAAVRECIPESVPMMLETWPSDRIPDAVRQHFLCGYAGTARFLANGN